MRRIIALAALLAAAPIAAEDVAVTSAVYLETASGDGSRQVTPARRLLRGDRVVTILRWDAPHRGRYTAVSPVPRGLAIESTSRADVEISTDGGRSWQRLDDPDDVPQRTTHLRWRIASGDGQLSYRAVVR